MNEPINLFSAYLFWFGLMLWTIYYTGTQKNFQVCHNEYSSWGNSRGRAALLCLRSFKSTRCSCSTYQTNFRVSYFFFESNANHWFWKKSNFLCVILKKGSSRVNVFDGLMFFQDIFINL